MGLLALGTALEWPEAKKRADQVRSWESSNPTPVFHPEFGRFMLEATPGRPWGIDFKELLQVEADMRLRFKSMSLSSVTSMSEKIGQTTVDYDLHNWAEDDDVRNGAAPKGFVHMDAMAFGFLVDTDVRWNQINARLRPEYLDPDLVVDEDIKMQLIAGGMDHRLATHFAHLFIRDPIVIFEEDLQSLDLTKTDHFENLQSTNWQHMRFKPPPSDNSIGWRVEFRPMEIQITDFENAAFSVFMVLVTRAILSFDLNFYIPIKSVPPTRPTTPIGPVEDEYEEMSINEIMNGSIGGYPGLIPIVESYLDSVNVDIRTRCELETYIDLVRRRASGELYTAARWIRDFIQGHKGYKGDSVVNDEVQKDLVASVIAIGAKEIAGEGLSAAGVPTLTKLIGSFRSK
ncbi:unnamed protein product [Parascedosporium putredinis]|uniref:Glutamate--cysteine ligase n=1 Tax=Parascedosporium putredinis TaxID=1442378 RepID=A0A9P1H033_9PEZI|nr:unnamed protein product [Parascedosporium putredinis]CAI7991371.1 unnamed protein product [Parascedosporium putredinis]